MQSKYWNWFLGEASPGIVDFGQENGHFDMNVQSPINAPQPFWAGRRLIILPAGGEPPVGSNRIPIWIDAEGIFGTGQHPTTGLCLQVLERHLSTGAKVIDVGTGTGILAVAAVKLGAGCVCAVDTDPKAMEAAIKNFQLNGVDKQIRIRQGSIEAIPEEAGDRGPASLVIANILAGALEQLFSEGLDGLVQPDGLLVLSGVLLSQTPALRACLQDYGFNLLAQEREEEWVCMLARRIPSERSKQVWINKR